MNLQVIFRKSKLVFRLKVRNRKKLYIWLAICIVSAVVFHRLLPRRLFSVSYSTVIEDNEGNLLSAIIADDGQWRFPPDMDVPEKFRICITQYEDARFYLHPGVDIPAIFRALTDNIRHRKRTSGASTLTMQVIRLSRKGASRTIIEKLKEMFLAVRLELGYSKKEILALYAAHAPFGGNVVGLEAAAWRYYGTEPSQLTWGQCATLAVLPNAPSLVYPGKNSQMLIQKRNKLLTKLLSKGIITFNTYQLAILEPLPGTPKSLPQEGIQLLNRAISDGYKGKRIRTTIQGELQAHIQELLNNHILGLTGNGVFNAAAIVIDVESGHILAYAGNSTFASIPNYQVDMLSSNRSPGSTLKPFLYAVMTDEGILLPTMLIPDIPTLLDGFNPLNFNRTYDGAVKAANALSRSLNIPAVHLLRQYGIEKFNFFLKKCGFTTFTKPPSHYGLSIILGGAEVTPEELVSAYAQFARILNHYNQFQKYSNADIHKSSYLFENHTGKQGKTTDEPPLISAASIWLTFQAMLEVSRPDQDYFWYNFSSTHPIAWKTGTSFGSRDAWSVGITPRFAVGVWAGNASGEGRPGLTGLQSAAPLLFEIFNFLPKSGWFKEPTDEMIPVPVCSQSGYRFSANCESYYYVKAPKNSVKAKPCPYHQLVHLNSDLTYQVNADCVPPDDIITKKFFVLPPVMEYYYKARNSSYKPLPPLRDDCSNGNEKTNFELIYPTNNTQIFLIENPDGSIGNVIFRAAHRKKDAVIFWHLNNTYIGKTKENHSISVSPEPGNYKLSLIDDEGQTVEVSFSILNRKKSNSKVIRR